MADDRNGPIVIFDGMCVFCSEGMRFIHRHDRSGTLRFAAMQSPAGRQLLERHELPIEDPDSFYVLTGSAVLAKSAALRFVARRLDGPWRLLGLFGLLPMQLLDRLYAVLVRNRFRIAGRRATCFAPPPDERHRFIV